jgi:hypothetical protein
VILQIATLAIGLVVWGAHAVAPVGLPAGSRRKAALAALPLAVASLMAMFAATAQRPDAALTVGFGPGFPISVEGRIAAVLLLAALISDGLALFLLRPDDPGGRALAAVLGGAGVLGFAIWSELLRLGEGPGNGMAFFWLAVGLRAGAALGAGELLLDGAARLAPIGAVALLAYPLALPPALRDALERSGDWLNLAAAGVLFLLARFLPRRVRRLALLAAVILAAIFFERAAHVSQQLQRVVPELWQQPTGR